MNKNILQLILAVSLVLIGCPAHLETSSDDSSLDKTADESASESLIHGGSPTTETWDDCGGQLGDHPCDFSFVDQFGDTFQLYDNYGTVMVLDFSTMWCSVCNNMAHEAQSFMNTYSDQDFLWVTVIIENSQGETPTEEDISNWVDLYGINDAPVLIGDRSIVDYTAADGFPIVSWPTLVIINREMVVEYGINGWSESTMTSWVESTL